MSCVVFEFLLIVQHNFIAENSDRPHHAVTDFGSPGINERLEHFLMTHSTGLLLEKCRTHGFITSRKSPRERLFSLFSAYSTVPIQTLNRSDCSTILLLRLTTKRTTTIIIIGCVTKSSVSCNSNGMIHCVLAKNTVVIGHAVILRGISASVTGGFLRSTDRRMTKIRCVIGAQV